MQRSDKIFVILFLQFLESYHPNGYRNGINDNQVLFKYNVSRNL